MAKHILIGWLQDAAAMGQGQLKMLEQYTKHFAAYPDIRSELQQHLLETRQQVNDITGCIRDLGSQPSAAKNAADNLAGLIQSNDTRTFKDGLTKNLLTLYAAEQFAYACYSALAEGARHAMLDEVADICERIAEEEMAMAEWIEEQLPAVVTATITARTEAP